MNIKKETAKRLLAVTDIQKICGKRIYRGMRLPHKENLKPPHIIIWLIRKSRVYDHDGYTGLTDADLQISCFSRDPDQADTMADLVRASMEAWPNDNKNIQICLETDESEGFEKNTMIHHIPLDYSITYNE